LYLSKGQLIAVEGRLQTQQWDELTLFRLLLEDQDRQRLPPAQLSNRSG
jgi:hypothetical protein